MSAPDLSRQAVNIIIKDLGIVLEYGKKNLFALPLSATVHQLYL